MSALAVRLDQRPPTISHHLDRLVACALITRTRIGETVWIRRTTTPTTLLELNHYEPNS